jgi:hypothetical protein
MKANRAAESVVQATDGRYISFVNNEFAFGNEEWWWKSFHAAASDR